MKIDIPDNQAWELYQIIEELKEEYFVKLKNSNRYSYEGMRIRDKYDALENLTKQLYKSVSL